MGFYLSQECCFALLSKMCSVAVTVIAYASILCSLSSVFFFPMAALGPGFQDPLESRTDSLSQGRLPLHSWENSSCRWTLCPTLSIFSFLPGQIRLKTENMGMNPGSEGSSDVLRQLGSLNLQFLVNGSFL